MVRGDFDNQGNCIAHVFAKNGYNVVLDVHDW